MFISGGLSILLAVVFLQFAGFPIFSRKLTWPGQSPGGFRSGGRRTRA